MLSEEELKMLREEMQKVWDEKFIKKYKNASWFNQPTLDVEHKNIPD